MFCLFHRKKNIACALSTLHFRHVCSLLFCTVYITLLIGCGTKTVQISDSAKTQRESTVWSAHGDGIPLQTKELSAFNSVGDFDKHLTKKQRLDVLLAFKKYIRTHRSTVEVGVERATLYFSHIQNVLKTNGLPDELAYLPFIESTYNTKAKSYAGAAGLWQFIPSTGKHYGLTQSVWYDERNDPYESTHSAAAYLAKLHERFEDWHLAISAYNAGEGKISRSLAEAGVDNFFALRERAHTLSQANRMTQENYDYLVKFLAACKVLRNLEQLGFEPIQQQSVTMAEISLKPGTDLSSLAKAANMSWEQFHAHNAAFLRRVSPPHVTTTVYVPHSQAQNVVEATNRLSKINAKYANWKTYTIKSGDTLSQIAARNGTSVTELRRVNHISDAIYAGQDLLVPPQTKKRTTASRSNNKTTTYKVKSGDTMWGIARKFNVNPQKLLAANGMNTSTPLRPGDVIKVTY